ncbi:MAG: hypothetical protein Q9225_000457 [Loekoesia sp. 1 TL-2023]
MAGRAHQQIFEWFKYNLRYCTSGLHSSIDPSFSPLEDVDLNSLHDIRGRDNDSDKENQEPAVEEPRLSFEVSEEEILSINEPIVTSDQGHSNVPSTAQHSPRTSRLFKRWISNLRPHSLKHKKTLVTNAKRWPLKESPREQHIKSTEKVKGRRSRHIKTHSGSSAGFVDSVKAAVMARPTSTPVSRKSRRSNLFSRSNRSSKLSENQGRLSGDHLPDPTNALEEAVLERSVQRQKTVEELVNSEASYVADLKVLIHAYFTLLATAPNGSQSTSAQVHQNVTEILRLHEDLLYQIQRIVRGLSQQTISARREIPSQLKHRPLRSTEGNRVTSAVVGLVHAARTSIDTARPTHTTTSSAPMDISSVAAITKIFERVLGRFFIYEEYGAQYELMLREMVLTSKSINNWHAFERSIEALANSLATSRGSEESTKKGLAFEDLVIKPIQRICKYPLLFEELHSNTLEADDAETRAELSKLLSRLREVTNEINKATNDRETQARIQRAWRLQDLLVLPDVVSRSTPQSLERSFRSQPDKDRYDVVAIINLSDMQLKKADDGREEQVWTQAIVQYTEKASRTQQDEVPLTSPMYTTLVLNAKPLGPVFGMFGSVTRRLSIQRAMTVHSRTNGAQVIIRNTTAAKENNDEGESVFGSVGRSKSAMTASRVPVLAPKRSERSRMEFSLSDVWSRDRLPFPGMSTHKGDHPLRASTSSMMRRLSRASISSTFSKRSVSTTSFAEIKPGASVSDFQKIGEGDDERDPRLDAYQSLRSTPGFDQDSIRKLQGSGKLVRTGTVKGVRLSDATNQVQDRETPRFSAQTVRIESTEKGSPRIMRNRRSVPGGFLKGFPTDGLKAWRA